MVIQLEVLQAKNDLRKNSLKEFIGMIAISIFRETKYACKDIANPKTRHDPQMPAGISSSMNMPPQPSKTPTVPFSAGWLPLSQPSGALPTLRSGDEEEHGGVPQQSETLTELPPGLKSWMISGISIA